MTRNVVMLVLQTYKICQSEVISPIVTSHGVYLVDFVCNGFGSYKVEDRVKSHKANGLNNCAEMYTSLLQQILNVFDDSFQEYEEPRLKKPSYNRHQMHHNAWH